MLASLWASTSFSALIVVFAAPSCQPSSPYCVGVDRPEVPCPPVQNTNLFQKPPLNVVQNNLPRRMWNCWNQTRFTYLCELWGSISVSTGRSGGQRWQAEGCVLDRALDVGSQHGLVAAGTADAVQDGSLNQDGSHTTREVISLAWLENYISMNGVMHNNSRGVIASRFLTRRIRSSDFVGLRVRSSEWDCVTNINLLRVMHDDRVRSPKMPGTDLFIHALQVIHT